MANPLELLSSASQAFYGRKVPGEAQKKAQRSLRAKKRPPVKGALRVSGLWGAKVAGDACQRSAKRLVPAVSQKISFFWFVRSAR
jgi:hypothetical protein